MCIKWSRHMPVWLGTMHALTWSQPWLSYRAHSLWLVGTSGSLCYGCLRWLGWVHNQSMENYNSSRQKVRLPVDCITLLTPILLVSNFPHLHIHHPANTTKKQIRNAMLKQPSLIQYSIDTLRAKLNFFVDELGIDPPLLPRIVTSTPALMGYSLTDNLRPKLCYIMMVCVLDQFQVGSE